MGFVRFFLGGLLLRPPLPSPLLSLGGGRPDVAEDPDNLIVYGGTGKAARNHEALKAILSTLKELEDDETLLVQSGKPVGVIRSHRDAPRVLIANSNLVPAWANWDYKGGFGIVGRNSLPNEDMIRALIPK